MIRGELEGLDYTITDNGDNTWTIVFDSVPGYYENASGVDTAISYYWLTYEGGKYFLYCFGGSESPYPEETIKRMAADKVKAWQKA